VSATGEVQPLTQEAWESYRDRLLQWDKASEAADRRLWTTLTSHEARVLGARFEWHPRFRGMTWTEVLTGTCKEVRGAQIKHRLLRAKPSPTAEDREELAALDRAWAPFGGPGWPTRPYRETAIERAKYELFMDKMRRHFTVDEWLRDQERGRQYPGEMNIEAFFIDRRHYVLAVAAGAAAVALATGWPVAAAATGVLGMLALSGFLGRPYNLYAMSLGPLAVAGWYVGTYVLDWFEGLRGDDRTNARVALRWLALPFVVALVTAIVKGISRFHEEAQRRH
jgi:hypothetical protein